MKKHHNTISKKLIIYFALLVILPVLVLSFVMQNAYRNSILEMAVSSAEMALNQIDDNISKQFQNYYNLAYFLTKDRQLQDLCALSVQSYNIDGHSQKAINGLMNGYRKSVDGAQVVGIAFENGLTVTSEFDDAMQHDYTRDEWYRTCMEQPDRTHLFNYYPGSGPFPDSKIKNYETISVCTAMRDKNGKVIGAVNVLVYNRVLEQAVRNVLGRKGSYVYIVSDQGTVVYSPVVQSIPEMKDASKYRTVKKYNESMGWTLVGVVWVADALSQITTLQGLLVVSLIIISIVMGISALAIGASIVRPLYELRNLMRQAEHGDLSVRFSPKTSDEVNDLGRSFNVMIEKLDLLIKQVYDVQKAKRKAEMAALQANIKPHFLYNTLDTIDWMAKKYKAADIMTTVEALSTLFRVSLSKGKEVITLDQEVLHVQSYLAIQKVRYEDIVDYSICVEEDGKELSVQKLILQPLVENAIYHGIKESGHNGHIQIRIWRGEDALFLCVEDDGIGMEPDRLEQVRNELKGFKSHNSGAYGVVNVHQRIVLNYGEGYGLSLFSERGVGTIAMIRHPIIKNNE